jgi:hypothetical protein
LNRAPTALHAALALGPARMPHELAVDHAEMRMRVLGVRARAPRSAAMYRRADEHGDRVADEWATGEDRCTSPKSQSSTRSVPGMPVAADVVPGGLARVRARQPVRRGLPQIAVQTSPRRPSSNPAPPPWILLDAADDVGGVRESDGPAYRADGPEPSITAVSSIRLRGAWRRPSQLGHVTARGNDDDSPSRRALDCPWRRRRRRRRSVARPWSVRV